MKRKLFYVSGLAMMLMASCAPKVAPAIPQDKEIESRVESILKDMTLEEKVGQMTQITITALADGTELTQAGDSIMRTYKVGSVLNTPGDMAQAPEEYNRLICQLNRISMETTGIPCLYGLDHVHGTTYIAGGTLFPQELSLAASFNRELAYNMGKVTAYESRAANVPWSFSPTMDLGRNPEWPRMWESFGEDTYLNSELAVAATRGMQGDDPNHIGPQHIAACLKHYLGYGVPVSGQDRTPSSITASEMREKYFEPFKECIQAGALSLMVNSASNNGIPFHCNHELLTIWLKENLNWDGVIITDWADISNLHTREKVAETQKEAVRLAINAGIDMAMVPYDCQFAIDLKALVEEGAVEMSRVDDAVRRILRLKFRLGLFDQPDTKLADYPEFGGEAHERMAYEAALESQVLAKNEGLLPLDRNARVLVTGPNGNSMRTLNGGWSYTWQGHGASMSRFTEKYNTIYEALAEKFGTVTYVPGVEYDLESTLWSYETSNVAPAVAAARNADVIVACIGENSYCETPGNLVDMHLSSKQKDLVKALAATGKPLVLVLNEGRPRIVDEIVPLAGAVVVAMLPGNHGADALASLLCGEENFSGKMPFTYPKFSNKHAAYDYKVSEKTETMMGSYGYNAEMVVQWPFGHGLSYTSFEYSNMTVDKKEFKADDVIKVSVDVKNTGRVAGKESVLLFSSDHYASCVPDNKRLRGFEKVALEPGASVTVTFELLAKDLAFVNSNGEWTLEEGDFTLSVGGHNAQVRCMETVLWEQPDID